MHTHIIISVIFFYMITMRLLVLKFYTIMIAVNGREGSSITVIIISGSYTCMSSVWPLPGLSRYNIYDMWFSNLLSSVKSKCWWCVIFDIWWSYMMIYQHHILHLHEQCLATSRIVKAPMTSMFFCPRFLSLERKHLKSSMIHHTKEGDKKGPFS